MPFSPLFWLAGFQPTKIDYSKRSGTLIRTSKTGALSSATVGSFAQLSFPKSFLLRLEACVQWVLSAFGAPTWRRDGPRILAGSCGLL